MKKITHALLSCAALTGALLTLNACKGGVEAAGGERPTPTYQVIELKRTTATLFSEYPANIQGVYDIDIRPKIDGYIDEIAVEEGQEVKKGQLLFRISNPGYGQDVENNLANIASAEAAVSAAELQVQKTKPLVEEGIISAYELRNAELNLKAKKAVLQQARAAYNNAKINQNYTTITSPVNGVVGNLPYKIGSYVNSNTAQPLTRVSDISKVYAYFSINEKVQMEIFDKVAGKNFQEKVKNIPSISLYLSNGSQYEKQGKIETFSGQINSQTGSFNVRAVFENDNRILRSGSSATIKIPATVESAIVIPQKATVEMQDKRLAYIVNANNQVEAVPVRVREIPGGQYFLVDEGLKPGQKLIIEGIGIVSEGTLIVPKVVASDSVLFMNK